MTHASPETEAPSVFGEMQVLLLWVEMDRLSVRTTVLQELADTATSTYHHIMRTTVTIDDDVYEAALANARATGRRLGRVLSDMARAALHPQPPRPSRRKRERFATFDVPEGSRMIPASRIQNALDEDGIV
jgi:hypothetical protein